MEPGQKKPTEIQRIVAALAERGGPMTVGELVAATGIKKEQIHSRCSTNARDCRFFVRPAKAVYDLRPDLDVAAVLGAASAPVRRDVGADVLDRDAKVSPPETHSSELSAPNEPPDSLGADAENVSSLGR